MLRSMYAGVSGLKSHQTKLDVVGNNIANVNTVGYKSSRVTFKELMTQTLSGASAPQNNRGGINPKQVGLGVGIGSIDVDHTQGNIKPTGISTDMAIEGNGYFIVNNGLQNLYTRAGSMSLDSNGNLINSNGFKIQGWVADEKGNINTNKPITAMRIPLGNSMPAKPTTRVAFGKNLDSRIENGVFRTAAIDVFDSLGNKHTVSLDFVRRITTKLSGSTTIGANTLTFTQNIADPAMDGMKITFVDNDADFDVEYDAGNKEVTVSADWDTSSNPNALDELSLADIQDTINETLDDNGFTGPLDLDFGGTLTNLGSAGTVNIGLPNFGATTGTVEIIQDVNNPDKKLDGLKIEFLDGTSLDDSYYDEENHVLTVTADFDNSGGGGAPTLQEVQDKINKILENNNITGNLIINTENTPDMSEFIDQELTISATSHWDWMANEVTDSVPGTTAGSGTITFNSEGAIIGGEAGTISYDPLNGAAPAQNLEIAFNDPSNPLKQLAANYTVDGIFADGYESGELESFSINETGIVTGNYSNGINRNLGQIAIAHFSNPQGLTKAGDTLFAQSKNSGIPQVGVAGSGGRGSISGGSLEMSNVDLAREFTEMITAQRGFQANSKIITTSDQILQDLVNLKR